MTSSDYPARYEAGESLLTLSIDAGCTPPTMRALLVRAGVEIRPAVGARGVDRALHTPTVSPRDLRLDPTARIARPSVARWLR